MPPGRPHVVDNIERVTISGFDYTPVRERVDKREPTCRLPCWGCIYVPRETLEAWEPAPHDPRMTDTNFALWADRHGLVWPILWDVVAVHLHW